MMIILFQASEELLSKHYADLSGRPFFPGLVKYMSSGPVVPMVIAHTVLCLIVNKTKIILLFF